MPGPGVLPGTVTPCDILAVDDTPANLTAIEAALKGEPYRIVAVSSGEDALRQVLEHDFAAILMDVQMPTMSGFEAARLIRARERSRHIPIIFITAHSDPEEHLLHAYALGAVDFLFKPLKVEILRAKLAVFAALHRRTREAAEQGEQLRVHELQERERWSAEQRSRLAAEVLQQSLEEQRTHAAELEVLNARLEEGQRRKDEFLALLGHELRNPLTPLVSGLALLEAAGVEGPRPAMQRQVNHLIRLVDDLLDMSRVMRGRIEIRRSLIRATDVLEHAVALSTPLFTQRGHTLAIESSAEDVAVDGDEVRLTQVLANLLNNAARYTNPGGHISVCCARSEGEVRFTVKDDGRGISAELLPRVFEFFVQGRQGSGGLGIGLGLVRQLVELHQGRVEARSDGESRGSEFSFWLPVSTGGALPGPRPEPLLPESKARCSLRLAVVEDNEDVRMLLVELLASWGHAVAEAANGVSGLQLILETRPDVVFIDIGLPDMDGYELGARVCTALGPRRPVLIALSGFGQEKDRDRALQAGFDHHLAKPASATELERVLGEAERQRELSGADLRMVASGERGSDRGTDRG
jgi:signal transduction histidine kinase